MYYMRLITYRTGQIHNTQIDNIYIKEHDVISIMYITNRDN